MGKRERYEASFKDDAVRLVRELRRVTEERDILKKAVGFFASERK
jgi:transposase-like protein